MPEASSSQNSGLNYSGSLLRTTCAKTIAA